MTDFWKWSFQFSFKKKNQIFSIYKKNLSKRSNLKKFLINLLGNFKIYKNPNFPPKSKTKKNWSYNQFSKEKSKNLLDFKRKELLFVRSSKILKFNMIKKYLFLIGFLIINTQSSFSQEVTDTIKTQNIEEIKINSKKITIDKNQTPSQIEIFSKEKIEFQNFHRLN